MSDQVRWFDYYAKCRCGKPSVGVLRGPGNQSYGDHCKKCGEARLKKAELERQREVKEKP